MFPTTLQRIAPFSLENLLSHVPSLKRDAQEKIQSLLEENPTLLIEHLLADPTSLGKNIHKLNQHYENTALVQSITRLFLNSANSKQQYQFTRSYTIQRDFSFDKFVDNLPEELLSLSLTGLHKLDDEDLIAISKKCPHLKALKLPLCADVTDEGLICLSKNCRDLETIGLLEFWEVSDTGIEALILGCPNLKELDIRGCSRVSEQAISEITERHPQINIFR